jgi:hypothetical protein
MVDNYDGGMSDYPDVWQPPKNEKEIMVVCPSAKGCTFTHCNHVLPHKWNRNKCTNDDLGCPTCVEVKK